MAVSSALKEYVLARAMSSRGQWRGEPIVRTVMPELDSVRGLAILMVVFYHGFAWSGGWETFSRLPRLFVMAAVPGWLGVDLFFVLSGFLITGILIGQKHKPDYYRNFYIRRALRIMPAFYLTLVFLIFVHASPQFVMLSAIYMSNLVSILGIPMDYGPLWSLAVEEHFYLLWPSAVRWLSARALAILSTLIVIVTPMLRAVSFAFFRGAGLRSYTWLVADGLALGALLAIATRQTWCTRERLFVIGCTATIVATLMLIVGAPHGIMTREKLLGAALQTTPWNLAFSGFLALVLLAGTSSWKQLVTCRILRFYGEISYGLYLCHVLVFATYDKIVPKHKVFSAMVIRFICVVSIATVVSWVSRKYFEELFPPAEKSICWSVIHSTAGPRNHGSLA